MSDDVNHPRHYTSHPSGIETIEITRTLDFALGNAVKYISRRDHKGSGRRDLEKALWYLHDARANMGKRSAAAEARWLAREPDGDVRMAISEILAAHDSVSIPTFAGCIDMAIAAVKHLIERDLMSGADSQTLDREEKSP